MGVNNTTQNNDAYGLTQPLINVFLAPIVSTRAPGVSDLARLGRIWVNKSTQIIYALALVAAGQATWVVISQGGSGSFTNIVASGSITAGTTITAGTGITSTTGNIVATAGQVNAGTTITAGTGITATAGNITATAGIIQGTVVRATGDLAGLAATTQFTSVVDNTQGVGALSITSASANPGTNTGFLKIYVGTAVAYVPYFLTIAP